MATLSTYPTYRQELGGINTVYREQHRSDSAHVELSALGVDITEGATQT
jgi:hypothetical protein